MRLLETGFVNQKNICFEKGKHLQKTMHYTTECGMAVARASVLFFICLLGCSDWFYDGLMPDTSLISNSSKTTKYD